MGELRFLFTVQCFWVRGKYFLDYGNTRNGHKMTEASRPGMELYYKLYMT
jgi:hypothetical protein